MFSCFTSVGPAPCKQHFTNKSRHYKQVSSRLNPEQIAILSLIFEDLSIRNEHKALNLETFLNFFNLTGLWGAKLFNQFDEDQLDLITFEQFLYGISQTAKAPFEQKIRLLYCFFGQSIEEGIDFRNFTKMLYNYSKDEIKQILLRDELISQEPSSAYPILKKKDISLKVVEVKMPESSRSIKSKSSFDQAYQSLLDVHNQGTYLEIGTNELTYKVKYSNMNCLIEEFAANIYSQHGLDVKASPHLKLSYQSFCNWIKEHKKLFKSYYSAFQTQIWAMKDSEPGYMSMKIDYEFSGKIQCGQLKSKVYGFQVGDVVICCQSKKTKRKPFKIICLQGLNTREMQNYAIEISDRSDTYKNVIFWFDSDVQHRRWVEHLKIYERDSIHQNYLTREVIGNGKFSIVYKCIQKSSGKVNALKVIDLNKLTQKARKAISNETQILKILNHGQIVKYIDTVKTKTNEYILTQYIYGEDLFEYVKKRDHLNEFESAFIIGNVINAVMHLHNLDIIHRDLKPENIMVSFKDKKADEIFQCTTPFLREGQRIQNVKIIDFGLSNHLSNLKKMEKSEKVLGTPNYIAPELLLGEEVSAQSDVFSIGSILYFLLRGRLPFASNNAEKTLLKTVKGDYDISSEHWLKVSQKAKDLLTRLLQVNPDQRITLKEAANHDWFSAVFNKSKRESSSSSNISQIESKQNKPAFRKTSIKLQSINLDDYQNRRRQSFNNYSQLH